MEKILYLMRHGQTLFNVRRKIQGVCDAPLTELGIGQARKAAEYFAEHQITFDHAYSSTSERACDTLEIVTGMPYKRMKGLKEWNFGVFEGESEDLNPKLPYGDYFKAFGGEGEIEVRERMNRTLTEIMDREEHQVGGSVEDTGGGASGGAGCISWGFMQAFYEALGAYQSGGAQGSSGELLYIKI